jgi:hypothetical protein
MTWDLLGVHSSIKRVDESISSIFRLEMLIRSAFVLAFVLPTLIGAKKTSPMDGIKGGVGSPDAGTVKISRDSISSSQNISHARTPGKLRVVENSGVCGRSILIAGVSPSSC